MIFIQKVENNIKNTLSKIENDPLELSLMGDPDLNKLIHQYWKIFSNFLPRSLLLKQEFNKDIKTSITKLVKINKSFLCNVNIDEQVRQKIKLLSMKVISGSFNLWWFSIAFVIKPVDWRMCINSIVLNTGTGKNSYSLPKIQESLNHLGQSICFTKIDLTPSY